MKNFENLTDVESDGRKINSCRDPPGQKSVYIVPGDPNKETYRLSTFHHFPRNVPVDPRLLARHGFYYTGYRDRVKCFSCGQTADNWLLGDDVTSSEWHNLSCDFVNGRETNNYPILALLQQYRQSSAQNGLSLQLVENLPEGQLTNQATTDENQATNTFSPEAPTTSKAHHSVLQPSSANLSAIDNSAINQTLSINPRQCNQQETENANKTDNNARNVCNETGSIPISQLQSQSNFAHLFQCRHPINPHMRSREARLQTFLDNSTSWPAHRIRTTPQQIVDAGMYYLGQRDRVKCWYCNGGLQNWDEDDDPWEEHAKWFPLCEFVLQQKGPNFVHRIVSQNPDLERPTLYNPAQGSFASSLVRNGEQRQIGSRNLSEYLNSSPVIVDPQKELGERNKKVEEEMKNSDLVNQARKMGFSNKQIEEAFKR